MNSDKLLAEKAHGIGRMIFNNPERHNAVSLEMWDAADEILRDFAADDAVRVVVLAGAGGKAFVSGADISKFEKERSGEDSVRHYNDRVRRAYDNVQALPKPTIAMVDGYCIGGGLALAVCCDLRFCSEKSRFGLPAAKLGLGYPFEGLNRLVATVGPGAARDITFSGRQLDAQEALDIGLVQKVLAGDELEDFVVGYAKTVAANAPLTVKAMKVIINEVLKNPDAPDLDKCRALVDEAFASEDFAEGRRAFMEKREPRFKGR
jgi:enoyl-CoA hydratase/carnithine racemase